jgi:hypothetical protein
MDEEPKDIKGKQPQSRLFQVVGIILFILFTILGWQFLEQKSIAESERTEKEAVKAELTELLAEYKKLDSDNAQLNSQLRGKQAQIAEMLLELEKIDKQSKEQAWMLANYKKESKTLRGLLKTYLHEIDSLGKTIIVLETEKSAVESNLTKEKARTQELSVEKEGLSEKVALGAKFILHDLTTVGVRFKGGGREKAETRARKADKIKTCFTIGANELAKPGERNIYIRVAGENGDVFPKDRDSSKVFIFEGKELVYSAKRVLNYQNQEVEVCLYFQKFPFVAERYSIDIFADGVQIGESAIKLE